MEAKVLKRVKIPARFHLVPSDASKASQGVTRTVEAKEVAASQNVAVREVVAEASDSAREARSQSPRLPSHSTRTWRTTGSRPVTRIKPTRDLTTILPITSRRTP